MTKESFDALVCRLEAYARDYPRQYRLRVVLLAGVWYAVVSLSLGLLVLLGLMCVRLMHASDGWAAAPLLIAMLIPAAVLVASLRVRIPRPVGLGLDRSKYPAIFDTMDSLSRTLDAPRVHRILLDDEFNAGMHEYPRLGLLGWNRNYLRVGLPLMQALTPEQFTAVLAHEMGHLSKRHGRFAHWVYRIERQWVQWAAVLGKTGKSGGAARPLVKFLRWYQPYFAAYTFVLRRAAEYEADRSAADVVGAAVAADALINTQIAGRFMAESVWPAIYRRAKDAPEPPAGVLGVVGGQLKLATAAREASRWGRQALMAEPESGDSHPQLAQRLAALGCLAETEVRLSSAGRDGEGPVVETTAATHFLGNALPSLIELLEKGWRVRIRSEWQVHYAMTKRARMSLRSLENKAKYGHLDDQEGWRLCVLTAELRGGKEAIPLLRDFQRLHRDIAAVNFLLGKCLIEVGDASGIEYMEMAMATDLSTVFEGCEIVADFLHRTGRGDAADVYLRRSEKHYHALKAGSRERGTVGGSDALGHHGLTGDHVYYLRVRLEEVEGVAEAYLAEKVMKNFTDRKLYVLGVLPQSRGKRAAKKVADQLLPKIAGFEKPLSVVVLDESKDDLLTALRAVKGTRIWPPTRKRPHSVAESGAAPG